MGPPGRPAGPRGGSRVVSAFGVCFAFFRFVFFVGRRAGCAWGTILAGGALVIVAPVLGACWVSLWTPLVGGYFLLRPCCAFVGCRLWGARLRCLDGALLVGALGGTLVWGASVLRFWWVSLALVFVAAVLRVCWVSLGKLSLVVLRRCVFGGCPGWDSPLCCFGVACLVGVLGGALFVVASGRRACWVSPVGLWFVVRRWCVFGGCPWRHVRLRCFCVAFLADLHGRWLGPSVLAGRVAGTVGSRRPVWVEPSVLAGRCGWGRRFSEPGGGGGPSPGGVVLVLRSGCVRPACAFRDRSVVVVGWAVLGSSWGCCCGVGWTEV